MEADDRVVNAQHRATALQQETQWLKEAHTSLENKLGEDEHVVERQRVKCQELAVQLEEKECDLSSVRESFARVEELFEQQSAHH